MDLIAGRISRWPSGLTEAEQTASRLGTFLALLFSGAFLGGVFLVLPLSALLRRRAARLSAADGSADADEANRRWELPAWIGWPLWAITSLGAVYVTYILLRCGLPLYFRRGK